MTLLILRQTVCSLIGATNVLAERWGPAPLDEAWLTPQNAPRSLPIESDLISAEAPLLRLLVVAEIVLPLDP